MRFCEEPLLQKIQLNFPLHPCQKYFLKPLKVSIFCRHTNRIRGIFSAHQNAPLPNHSNPETFHKHTLSLIPFQVNHRNAPHRLTTMCATGRTIPLNFAKNILRTNALLLLCYFCDLPWSSHLIKAVKHLICGLYNTGSPIQSTQQKLGDHCTDKRSV